MSGAAFSWIDFFDGIPGVITKLSRGPASLAFVSKAMASSRIVRDAFHLYIRLARQLLQSIPDNPNENDLTCQRSRRNDPRCNKSGRRWTVPQRKALRTWWSVMMNTTPTSSLCSTSFNTKESTMRTKKTRKRKKWKIQIMKKRIEKRGLKEQRRAADERILWEQEKRERIQDAESLKSWVGKGTKWERFLWNWGTRKRRPAKA